METHLGEEIADREKQQGETRFGETSLAVGGGDLRKGLSGKLDLTGKEGR